MNSNEGWTRAFAAGVLVGVAGVGLGLLLGAASLVPQVELGQRLSTCEAELKLIQPECTRCLVLERKRGMRP